MSNTRPLFFVWGEFYYVARPARVLRAHEDDGVAAHEKTSDGDSGGGAEKFQRAGLKKRGRQNSFEKNATTGSGG